MRSTRSTIPVMLLSLRYTFFVTFLVLANVVRAQPIADAQSFSPVRERYVPFACSEIAGREWNRIGRDRVLTWRDTWPDTAPSANYEPQILAKVRACVANYAVATTRPEQLIGLGATYLTLKDTIHASDAFERVIKLGAQQSVERRAFDLSQIVSAYISARWLREAVSYMARLDALGPAVAGRRVYMHNELYTLAAGMDSIPFMVAQVNGIHSALSDLRGDARHEWLGQWEHAIVSVMDLEGRRKNFAAMRRLKVEASAAWDSVKPGEGTAFWIGGMVDPVLAPGDSAPPLKTDIVYLPGEKKPSTVPLHTPVRGKVSLIVSVGGQLMSGDIGAYQVVTQLRRKFPANVLDITLATQTTGVSWETLKMVPNAQDEAESIRAFYHEYLRLPVPIAVRVNSYSTDPKTGYRSLVEEIDPKTHMAVKDPYRNLRYKLIDKFGIVRDVLGGNPRLENEIRELLAE